MLGGSSQSQKKRNGASSLVGVQHVLGSGCVEKEDAGRGSCTSSKSCRAAVRIGSRFCATLLQGLPAEYLPADLRDLEPHFLVAGESNGIVCNEGGCGE